MRIAILADALDNQYAGIHFYTKGIVEALDKCSSKHQFLLIKSKKSSTPYKNFEEKVVPNYPKIPGYQTLRLFVQIPRIIKKWKADIVIEPGHFGPFNLPDYIKKITVIHDLTPLLFPEWHTFNGWFLQKLFLPGIIERADHLITNSHYTQQDLIKYFPNTTHKSTPIHLGIDRIFCPSDDPAPVLKTYGINRPYLIYVGTIEPRKNIHTLVKSFELFRNDHPNTDYQLVIVGKKGWKADAVYDTITNSDYKEDIIITGYVPRLELPALYSGASVLVYPSLYEGFGFPILEALACGTPVIASKISSMPEIGGDVITLFSPVTPQNLHQAIEKVLIKKEIPSKEAIQNHLKAFTWENNVAQLIEVLEELGGEKKKEQSIQSLTLKSTPKYNRYNEAST